MQIVSVLEFNHPQEFLSAVFEKKRKINPRFSIRAWSRQIGHKNPTVLARILKGERPLHPRLASQIADSLRLTGKERKYFEVLVLFHCSETFAQREVYTEILAGLRPKVGFHSLTLDAFRYISDWWHLAILEMIELKDFNPDPSWIAARLGGGISAASVESAIARMTRLELISRDEEGRLVRSASESLNIGDHVPSEAVRKHHRQMIEKALDSIENQKITERQLLASTFSLPKKSISSAQAIVKRCHEELLALAARGNGDETYQFNSQLFQLTQTKQTKGEKK